MKGILFLSRWRKQTNHRRNYSPLPIRTLFPGYKLGELNLTQTPLGISLRLKMNVLDQKEAEKLLTLHLEGVEFHGAGSIDPNGYALFSQGQGQFGDIPTIRFLDWDKNTIAEASFERVD